MEVDYLIIPGHMETAKETFQVKDTLAIGDCAKLFQEHHGQ